MPEMRKRRVLIVEDEPDLSNQIAKKLTDEGYDTFTADDGVSGLTVALDKQPDLILLDIRMPNSTGFEMLQNLRERGNWGATVPVLFLTNLEPTSDEEIADLKALNPIGYIVKSSVDLAGIAAQVRTALRQSF